jgi:hypothetical protein
MLFYPLHTIGERVEYRAEVGRLRGSPDVEFVADLRRGFPLQEVVQEPAGEHTVVLVQFQDELMRTDDPSLLEIHERRRIRSDPAPTTTPPTTEMPEIQQRLLSQYLQTTEGRERLAVAMSAPLRARRDYVSIARQAIAVEQLPPGALPIYDSDPDPDAAPRVLRAEVGLFSSPLNQGLGATIMSVTTDVGLHFGERHRVRVGNLAMMTPNSVGRYLEIRNGQFPGNNGIFQIVEFHDATSVTILNAHATIDYVGGHMWLEHPAPGPQLADPLSTISWVPDPIDPHAKMVCRDAQARSDVPETRGEPVWTRILDDSFLSED